MEKQASFQDVKRAMIEELLRGRDLANQMLQLAPCHHDLVNKILRSFTNTILFLFNSSHFNGFKAHDEISIKDSSSALNDASPKYEKHDSNESCIKSSSSTTRNLRGFHKRKRNTESWVKDSPILVDDGHLWRKYGQKMTMNAKYLRNYYRCAYKVEQGCPALKYVQRIQDEPPLHRTIYYGLHTCKHHHFTKLDPSSPSHHHSDLLSFNNNTNDNNNNINVIKEDTLPTPTKQDHIQPFKFVSSSSSSTHEKEELKHKHGGGECDDVAVSVFSSVMVESFDDDDVLRCFDDFDDIWF